ncbi:DUF6446 family protein [Parasulfitobacter algicola]|uniref:Histidine kinase n=1 Tax=Parasulfitobacter algicola TaxID=2614809 RepID=A0ABX2IP87_9RHOB|nr:DUF6446 family protein [Sulfitobacter algicola]NSX54706.1 histidine kinase [Sulfitobacter algicola]
MSGKIIGIFIVIVSLIAGGALYYLQVYAFYAAVEPNGVSDVQMTPIIGGQPEPILYDDFQAIDANSSPVRYRACFTTPQSQAMMTETYVTYDRAEPLEAPGWFDCFNADDIGAALENETAFAFMGTENITYGIDRVIAIMDDGRGFVWHQINACGEVVFDGRPTPDGCPEPPVTDR